MKKYRVETRMLSGYKTGEILSNVDGDEWFFSEDGSRGIKKDTIERNPEWFSPVEEEFEKGDWVVTSADILFRITHINDKTYGGYGFDMIEGDCWFDEDYNVSLLGHVERKATKDEIESALIAEAKRRGYKADNFECLVSADSITSDEYDYHSDADILYIGTNACYVRGKWAEIVDEPIQINGYDAEFKDGYVQFGCAKIDNEYFLQLSQGFNEQRGRREGRGNRIIESIKIGRGEFTVEQIHKIAKRIKNEDYEIKGSGYSFSAENMWENK